MVCGTIKWFDRKKGFGFVAMGDEEVFVHYTNIVTENGRWLLDDGVEVTFELGSHNGKPTAVSVTVSIPSVGGRRSAPLAFGLGTKDGRRQRAATAKLTGRKGKGKMKGMETQAGLETDAERIEAAVSRLLVGDPYAAVSKVLSLRQSCFQQFTEDDVPDVSSRGPIGENLLQLTLFMPPNGYTGSKAEWTLGDVKEWLFLLPRPGTVQGDLLTVFELYDGRFVYIRALSDYYSGFWQGISVRVYVGLDLESLEEYGMGFKVSRVETAVAGHLIGGKIEVDSKEHRKAWGKMSASLSNVDRWLVCNRDEHSSRRGNCANS